MLKFRSIFTSSLPCHPSEIHDLLRKLNYFNLFRRVRLASHTSVLFIQIKWKLIAKKRSFPLTIDNILKKVFWFLLLKILVNNRTSLFHTWTLFSFQSVSLAPRLESYLLLLLTSDFWQQMSINNKFKHLFPLHFQTGCLSRCNAIYLNGLSNIINTFISNYLCVFLAVFLQLVYHSVIFICCINSVIWNNYWTYFHLSHLLCTFLWTIINLR